MSFTQAADELCVTQGAVSRQIRELEGALGVELFQRHPRGLRLTAVGVEMRPAAEEMRAAMARIELAAEAEAGELHGTVRISSSVFAAHHILPGLLADIREQEPAIDLILQPSDETDNLTFRESDIAVRMYRPRQLDLIARHIGDIEMAAFAATRYLDRRGRPTTVDALRNHDLVGYDRARLMLDVMDDLGIEARAEDFALRTDNQTVYWELVRAGGGVGFTQANVGRADPLVEELPLGLTLPDLPVWLTAHETVRHIPRVDRIWTLLADGLGRVLSR